MGKRHESVASSQGKGSEAAPLGAALDALAAWFEKKKRVLPWRDEPTLYRVWVSEIMLQQTQVITVVPYFERFMARFPTVEGLASAPPEDVLAQWAGLGYYSRARNLHKGAQMIVAAGKQGAPGFPRDREGWLGIPGVGQYTAGAILSIALDQPEAILDGNVERVLSRVHLVSRAKGDAQYKETLWERSREVVRTGHERGLRPNVLNQALMELGATTCTPRKPLCVFCPLKEICGALARGEQEAYPPRKKPKEWLRVKEELHCVLDGRGRVLLRRREAGEWRAGLWDLLGEAPGAKLERVGQVETKHVVTRHKIERVTHVWRMKPGGGKARLKAAEAGSGAAEGGERWISVDDPEVAVGSALKRTLQAVRERYEGSIETA